MIHLAGPRVQAVSYLGLLFKRDDFFNKCEHDQ